MIHQHPVRHNRGVDNASFMLAHHIQRAGLIVASPHPAGCQRRFALPQQIGDFRFQQQLVAVDIAASGLLLVLFGQPLPLMREFVLCGFLWRVGPKHRRCNGGIGGAQTHPQRRDPRIGRQVEHEQLAVRRHHVAFQIKGGRQLFSRFAVPNSGHRRALVIFLGQQHIAFGIEQLEDKGIFPDVFRPD